MGGKKKHISVWNLADSFEGDKVVWLIALMLIMISIVCIFSSTSKSLVPGETRVDKVKDQLLVVAVGLGVMLLCYSIKSISIFRWFSRWGFLISVALLAIIDLHLDFGPDFKAFTNKGATRIILVFNKEIHVFEIVKVAMVMYLSWAVDAFRRKELPGTMKDIWKKVIYIYVPFLTIFVMVLPGSNSSALLIGGIMYMVILFGGDSIKELSVLLAAGLAALLLCMGIYKVSDGKMFGRIGTGISRVSRTVDYEDVVHTAPKNSAEYNEAIDKLRQPYNAKIAIRQGSLVGKGPGQSTQRYVLSDVSEDYIYSFIIEEYGLAGGILIIILYVSLMARGAIIVRNCGSDRFAKLAVAGLCLLITGQAFLHMLVNVDIGPMTGQTLPLISHGNSAFLCFSLAFGILLSFSRIAIRRIEREAAGLESLSQVENRQEDDNGQQQ